MNLKLCGLLLVAFGAASAVAQEVPKALEQSSTVNSVITKNGVTTFFAGARPGKWWTRPEEIERLGLSADQRKNLNDILQQHRLKLIDLDAGLQREGWLLIRPRPR